MHKSPSQKIQSAIFGMIVAAIIVLIPITVSASFNPEYIVSDFEFFNYNSMSVRGIQQFLESQPGQLKSNSFTTDNGTKTAAEIIYNAAQQYHISPKVILVTLQKEMSLITDSTPTQRQFDVAMGYGCPDSGGCNPIFEGFFNQVDNAAWQIRRYTDYPKNYAYQIGRTYTFTDLNGSRQTTATIRNQATANLYNYTPHVYNGNYNFYNLWSQWFQIKYPDGTLIRAEGEPGVWLINHGKRYGFHSSISFITRGYTFNNVIVVPKPQVLSYEYGGHIDFPDLSFVKDAAGNLFFIDGLEKRPVSVAVKNEFIENGLLYEQEIITPQNSKQVAVLSSFDVGKALPSPNSVAYPTGVLLQNKDNGSIGYVKEGVMHMLHSKEVLHTQFPNRSWVRVSAQEFNSFKRGEPIKLRDGTLVRAPKYGGGVFIISNGTKRPITSREVFDGLGFKMENVVKTNDRTIDIHPTGPPFDAPK